MAVMLHILDDGEALGNIATAAVGNKVQVLVRKLGLLKIRTWSAHPPAQMAWPISPPHTAQWAEVAERMRKP